MKKIISKLSAVLLLTAFFSTGVLANSYDDHYMSAPFYAEILEAAKTKDALEMVHFLDTKMGEDRQRIHPISIWLRDNSVRQRDISKVNSLYFLSYSDILFVMAYGYKKAGHDKEFHGLAGEALQSLYVFETLAMADALRCEDTSALFAVDKNTLMERIKDPLIKETYLNSTKEAIEKLVTVGLSVENYFASRPHNRNICSMGAAKMADLLKQQGVQTKDIADPSYVGGHKTEVIAPSGYKYEPKYISDEEWDKKRTGLSRFLQIIREKRYEEMVKHP